MQAEINLLDMTLHVRVTDYGVWVSGRPVAKAVHKRKKKNRSEPMWPGKALT